MTSTAPTPSRNDQLTPLLKWISNLMRLSGLCAHARCRRASCCRGEPRDCLQRYARIVPEDAREGVKGLVDGMMHGLSFDEVRDEDPAIDDLIAWRELVDTGRAR